MERDSKWIFSRHTKDLETLEYIGQFLQNKSILEKTDRKELINTLNEKGIYKKRFEEVNISTLMNKISDLNFYMFGYKEKIDNEQRFLFSPLGNLYLKYVNDTNKKQKIFTTMLWGLQYKHPHNSSNEKFNLYPFRIILKLLLDSRIQKKLFVSEIAYIVMFCETMKNENEFSELINDILKLRNSGINNIKNIFENDKSTLLVNAVYEWDYYVKAMLIDLNLLTETKGDIITKLVQGKSTTRRLYNSYVEIDSRIEDFIEKLNLDNSIFDKPLDLKSENKLSKEITKEIYNFCPNSLLIEIGEEIENYEILKLPNMINEFAENPNGEGYDKFENILEESLNMFINVEANKKSGPGKTDIECIYLDNKEKFAVEAKSTKHKLNQIIAGRLKEHLRLIGGKYTIVITPRYVPAVRHDIKNTNIVILLASTFSEYLYNHIIQNNREIDYTPIHKIIEENLGTDISSHVSKLTFDKFAKS